MSKIIVEIDLIERDVLEFYEQKIPLLANLEQPSVNLLLRMAIFQATNVIDQTSVRNVYDIF